jgi:hypothetical protein
MDNRRIQINIATVLRKIGSDKCVEKANIFENTTSTITTLNFRNLALDSSDVISIMNCLKQKEGTDTNLIRSISFSYNSLLGNSGAIAIAKNLPTSLHEIGLVNCGISDAGRIELLDWMKKSRNLKMVCIEQNNFSKKLRIQLKQFGVDNPQILLVI